MAAEIPARACQGPVWRIGRSAPPNSADGQRRTLGATFRARKPGRS